MELIVVIILIIGLHMLIYRKSVGEKPTYEENKKEIINKINSMLLYDVDKEQVKKDIDDIITNILKEKTPSN